MYGVSPDLDVALLVGREVEQLRQGAFDLQLVLNPTGLVSIQGELVLLAEDNAELQSGTPEDFRDVSLLGRLLGSKIQSVIVRPPREIDLAFDSGLKLRLIDSSDQYESFQIEPGSIVV